MMLCDQLPHLLAVKFWPPITKLFLKGIAQRFHIAVFAKNQRNHQPVIARADLAVRTMVTVQRCAKTKPTRRAQTRSNRPPWDQSRRRHAARFAC